jgi:type IV secretion system protein VirB10
MSDATASGGVASNDPVSPVAGGRRLLSAKEKLLIGVGIFAACGLVALWPSSKPTPERERAQPIEAASRSLPYRPMAEAAAPAATPTTVASMPVPPTPASMQMVMPGAGSSVAFGGGGGRPLANPTPIMSYEDRSSPPAQPVQDGGPGTARDSGRCHWRPAG